MKCLEPYTIEMVKEMSYEELKLLYQRVAEEQCENDLRREIISRLQWETRQ